MMRRVTGRPMARVILAVVVSLTAHQPVLVLAAGFEETGFGVGPAAPSSHPAPSPFVASVYAPSFVPTCANAGCYPDEYESDGYTCDALDAKNSFYYNENTCGNGYYVKRIWGHVEGSEKRYDDYCDCTDCSCNTEGTRRVLTDFQKHLACQCTTNGQSMNRWAHARGKYGKSMELWSGDDYVMEGCGAHKDYFEATTFVGARGGSRHDWLQYAPKGSSPRTALGLPVKYCYTIGGYECQYSDEWGGLQGANKPGYYTATNKDGPNGRGPVRFRLHPEVRWRECDGYMGCNAVEGYMVSSGQSAYLIDTITTSDRPDWTECCKECTLSEPCESWSFYLTAEGGECSLYSVEAPDLTRLEYNTTSTAASFFGTQGFNDEPLDADACERVVIHDAKWPETDQSAGKRTTQKGACTWEALWRPYYLIWQAGFITCIVGAVLTLLVMWRAPYLLNYDINGWVDGQIADVSPHSVTITGQRTETRTHRDKNGTHTTKVTITDAVILIPYEGGLFRRNERREGNDPFKGEENKTFRINTTNGHSADHAQKVDAKGFFFLYFPCWSSP